MAGVMPTLVSLLAAIGLWTVRLWAEAPRATVA